DGKRCGERVFLELHHVLPHGDGGEASLANIELRCRAHNAYEADLYFGPSNEAVRNAAIQKRNRRKPGDEQFVVRESPGLYGSRSSGGSKREFGLDRIHGAGSWDKRLAARTVIRAGRPWRCGGRLASPLVPQHSDESRLLICRAALSVPKYAGGPRSGTRSPDRTPRTGCSRARDSW